MTLSLEKVISEVQKLPEHDQDVLASIIMEEIFAENEWDVSFATSQDALEKLANEALTDFREGKTKPMEFK